jgi:hypothetical protein
MALDPLTGIFEVGKSLIDKLIPDPNLRAQSAQKLLEMKQNGELAQLAADKELMLAQADINKIEAASPLTFISGARPAIIWVCGAGLAVAYVIGPLIEWGSALFQHPIVAPKIDVGALTPLLTGVLGLSALRSFDKFQGSASK